MNINKNLSFLLLTIFIASCEKSNNGGNKNNSIFDQQWYLKNTGQKSYSNTNGVPGIDVNLPLSNEYTGKGVSVIVSDSGVDFDHPDLENNMLPNSSLDFTASSGTSTINKPNLSMRESHHGSNVAGVIGGSINKENGFRGIAPDVKLASVNSVSKLIKTSAISDFDMNMALYQLAQTNGIHVINESWGSGSFKFASFTYANNKDIDDYIKDHKKEDNSGFIIVKAAGNETCDTELAIKIAKNKGIPLLKMYDMLGSISESSLPSLNSDEREILRSIRSHSSQMDNGNRNPFIISVAALSANGTIADYSSIGANIWVTGLGGSNSSATAHDGSFNKQDINSPRVVTTRIAERATSTDFSLFNIGFLPENKNLNYTSTFSGTSAAAPTVSGVIALMLQANPNLSLRDVKHILAKTSNRDKLTADPKPYCVKILEKIGDFNTNFSNFWNEGWVQNKAGNFFHNYYGFGLIDASKAIEMAKGFHSPFIGKNQEEREGISEIYIGAARDIEAGNIISKTINIPNGDNLIIEAVQVTPYIEAAKADGLGIELVSPRGTKSVLLHPGNSFIELDANNNIKPYKYPVTNVTSADIIKGGNYLTNAFYEESSQGDWKLIITNSNNGFNNAFINSWKIKIIGHK